MNKYRIQITRLYEYKGEVQEKKVFYKDVFEKCVDFAIWKVVNQYQKEELYLLGIWTAKFINSKRDTAPVQNQTTQRQFDPELFEHENYLINHEIKLVPYFYNWFNMQKFTPKQLKRKFRIESN